MADAHHNAFVANIPSAVGTTVTRRTVRNRLLKGQLRAKGPVARIPLLQIIAVWDSSGVKSLPPTVLISKRTIKPPRMFWYNSWVDIGLFHVSFSGPTKIHTTVILS
ncbi:hypothetical protein TNCV_4423541 [Trichonephila clavipes]|nr:hypothetical protein TNCV_4423541 [Trichonephila clavipes]